MAQVSERMDLVKVIGTLKSLYENKVSPIEYIQAYEKNLVNSKKKTGSYYTPQYIAKYIVENTVGEKIKNLNPIEIQNIKILDPSCGGGIFLIEAFDYLLQYHKNWYLDNLDNSFYYQDYSIDKNDCIQISLIKKASILRNNIFGVDIDHEATEVSIMSLYLKMLDDGFDKGQQDLFFAKGSILPDMSENIKCGNSLVGSDYFDGKLDIDLEELRTIKPFDWAAEGTYDKDTKTWVGRGFPEIMKNGGFDCVIGNPPYVFTRELISKTEKFYYNKVYTQTEFKLNTYVLFSEKAIVLLKDCGYWGYIVPNNWISIETAKKFRFYILNSSSSLSLINCKDKVFDSASVDTAIIILKKSYTYKKEVILSVLTNDSIENINHLTISNAQQAENLVYRFTPIGETSSILSKITECSEQLEKTAIVKNGVQAYTVGEGIPKQTVKMKEERIYHNMKKIDNSWIKYVDGVDVARYCLGWSGQFIKYGKNLSRSRTPDLFLGERILVRQIPNKPPYCIHAAYASEHLINDNNSMIVKSFSEYSLLFLLALLNSKLMSYWFIHNFGKMQRKIFPQFKVKELAQFPIRKIDFSDAQQKEKHDNIVSCVEQMMRAVEEMQKCVSDQDKSNIRKKIRMIDDKLDNQVYQLYGLTDDEIKIIEESTTP